MSDLTPPAAGQPAPPLAEGTTWLPSGRVRPPSPQGARQISLRRASEALTSALRLGRDGYRGLRTLTESGRVPVQVRVQALRHLAADFGDRDVSPILERAMASDVPGLQNAALSAVMLRRDAALGPLVTLSTRPDVEVATRVRAVRFMASRFPKAETRASLEALLEAGDPDVRRAALEALFTSMRFVPPDQVEAGLVNILKEHHELEVRVSAARALGAFGGHQAQSALRWAAGFSGDGALKQAAREALERLKE